MSHLFRPINYGLVRASNRLVIAPMCIYSAKGDGHAQFFHEQQWAQYATSGVGMFIIEATAVQENGRISYADLGLWSDSQKERLKVAIGHVKEVSPTPMFIQLAHAGRKASCNKPWISRTQLPVNGTTGWETVAPSPIPFESHERKPLELTVDQIQTFIRDFAAAAKRAVEAGFDGIEIHAAHGYLLHEFLSALSNVRTDAYGGSEENRCRLLMEVLAAVKAVVPAGYPVGVRLSATDWMEENTSTPADSPAPLNERAWEIEQTVRVCKALAAAGADFLHISSGGLHVEQNIKVGPLYQVPFAKAVVDGLTEEQRAKCPVIAVGLVNTPQDAEGIVKNGQADAVAIARGQLWNPHFAWHAAAELGGTVYVPHQYHRCQPADVQRTVIKGYEEEKYYADVVKNGGY